MDDHQAAPAPAATAALSLEEMIRNTSRSRLAQLRSTRKRKRTGSSADDDQPPAPCCDNCSELGESSKRLENPETSDETRGELWDLLARELPDDPHLCDHDESPNVKGLIMTALHTLSQKSSPYKRQAVKVFRVLVDFKQNHRALVDCGGFATLVILLVREDTRAMVKQLAFCLSELIARDASYSKAINAAVESVVDDATSPQDDAQEEKEEIVYLQNLVRVYRKLEKVYVGDTKSVKRVMLVRDLMDVLTDDGNAMAKLVAVAFFHNALHLTDPLGDIIELGRDTLTTSYVLRESIEEIIDAARDEDAVPKCKQLACNILFALAKNYPSAHRTIKAHQLLYKLDLLPPGM